jgi:hypothetical protein
LENIPDAYYGSFSVAKMKIVLLLVISHMCTCSVKEFPGNSDVD